MTVPGLVYNGRCLRCNLMHVIEDEIPSVDDHQISQTTRDNEINRLDGENGLHRHSASVVRQNGIREFQYEEETIEQQAEEMDVLEQCVAQYMERNQVIPTFQPGTAFIPNSELAVNERKTDFSVLTMPTVFLGSSQSVASTPNGESQPAAGASNSSKLEPIHELTDLDSVRNAVNDYLQNESDAKAIEAISSALTESSGEDVVVFCLNNLWALVRKSDENKRNVLFGFNEDTRDEETPFGAIIGTMLAFVETSSEIQTKACAVLWSLSVIPEYRNDVAQLGGCEAILQAMLWHTDNESLQVMALGALNVLSRNAIGKTKLNQGGASLIAADVMINHTRNEEIQSTGCGVICNLAAGQFVGNVTEREVSALLNSIISHPTSCRLHKDACFVLLSLAYSGENAELIREHPRANEAIYLAFQRHAYAVGDDISRLTDVLLRG